MPIEYSKDPRQIFADIKKLGGNIPRIAGNLGVRHFKDSFTKQGWDDEGSIDKWPARKSTKRTHALLVKSGALRRSIRIVRVTRRSVIISSELIYAEVHNSGSSSAGGRSRGGSGRRQGRRPRTKRTGGRGQNIPRRQFMGESRNLERQINKNIERRLRIIITK